MKLTKRQVTLILQAIGMAMVECNNELKKSVIIEHRNYWLDKKQELYECSQIISSLGVEDEL
jgi:hypothetical protein